MNHDLERLLGSLTPLGPRPELRERVLAKVQAELESSNRFHWARWCAAGIAAGLVLGALLNGYVSWRHTERLAKLMEPASSSSDTAILARNPMPNAHVLNWQPVFFASHATSAFSLYAQTVDRLLQDFEAGGKGLLEGDGRQTLHGEPRLA